MPLLANLLALDAAYQPLVDRATARLFKTRVTREPSGTYIVHSSYNEDARLKFRELGMKWDPAKQGWRGTDDQAAAAIKMLCQHDGRRGTSALGADGQLIPLIDPASPMEEHEQ